MGGGIYAYLCSGNGGTLQFLIWKPFRYDIIPEKKYEITDIAHPRYPWLHRIRSLERVNEHVPEGTLGGFVESEANLSGEGSCWIYDDAICCEQAKVEKEAELSFGAMARGEALVTGDAQMCDRSLAEGRCCIRSGEIKDRARIAGDAVIGESIPDGLHPVIGGNSNVYGTVRGWFMLKGTVLPGEELVNPTKDLFVLEHGKREVLVSKNPLTPPGQEKMKQQKKEVLER